MASICSTLVLVPLLAAKAADAGTIDPRLVAVMAQSAAKPVPVWVTFRDKGARDAAGRAALLAQAEADLSPRNRARRLRAGVTPLVDELDVPVHPEYLQALAERGLEPHAVSRWLNRAAVRVPGARLAEIARLPFVTSITPVAIASVDLAPVAPEGEGARVPHRFPPAERQSAIDHGQLEAALQQISVPALHDSGYTGAGVLVCLLDAGFNWHDRHEALAGKVIAPGHARDFVDGDSTVTDTTNGNFIHGTVVMGCIAGNRPGTYVGSGYGAEFALARTENASLLFERPVEMLWWGMGAEWADSLGADLISSSLGYFEFDGGVGDYTYEDMDGRTTDISRSAQIAASKGILVVNSVGNFGTHPWHYLIAPADVHGDSLIAVGSVDASGAPAASSSYGPSADGRIKPDLAARGENLPVVSTFRPPAGYNPAAYSTNSGTSLSAPLVAGLAACVMQARPDWTPQQVIAALRASASRATSPDNRVGYGIPNGLDVLRGPVDPGSGGRRIDFALHGPNPRGADDVTNVSFLLMGQTGPVSGRVRIYDVRGRSVRELWNGTLEPGRVIPPVSWDGRDDDRRSLPSGLYWIAIDAGGQVAAERVVMLK